MKRTKYLLLTPLALLAAFAFGADNNNKPVYVLPNGVLTSPMNFWQTNVLEGEGIKLGWDSIKRPKIYRNSVLAYGADGRGVYDDTESIQLAINLNSNKPVLFPAGTYRITRPLVNLTGRSIVGEGVGSVIRGENLSFIFYASNTANLTLKDVRVQGSNTVVGLYAKYAQNLNLEKVKIDSCTASNQSLGTFGLTVWNSTNVSVTKCVFEFNGFDPGDTTNQSAHVTGSMIFSGNASGECENITVQDCIVLNRGTYAVQFTDCNNVRALNNIIDQGNVGVAPHQNGYGINCYDGSHIYGSGNREKRLHLIGNTVTNCAGIGIYIVLGDEVVISRNFVDNVAQKMNNPNLLAAGINVNECRRFTVSENVVCNVGFTEGTYSTAGIAIIAGEHGNVTGNCITNVVSPTGDGINIGNYGQYTMQCSDVNVSGNTVFNTTRTGVISAGRILENCYFGRNRVYAPGLHGYWLDKLTRCVVEHNELVDYGASGYGYWVLNTGGTNWFNTFRANRVINQTAARNGAAFRVIAPSNIFEGNIAIGIQNINTAFQDVGGSNVWSANLAMGSITKAMDLPASSAPINGNYTSYPGTPTNVPSRVAQMHLDTTAKSLWMATGTSSVDDWHPISTHGLTRTYNWDNDNTTWEFTGHGTENANLYTEGHWYMTAGAGFGFYFGNYTNLDMVRISSLGYFLVKEGGKVGVGTNLPQSALHVNGTIRTDRGLALPGYNAAVGSVWKCTNNVTGEGHWAPDMTGEAGSGIGSLNGDTTAAQAFAAGTGLSIATLDGTHTWTLSETLQAWHGRNTSELDSKLEAGATNDAVTIGRTELHAYSNYVAQTYGLLVVNSSTASSATIAGYQNLQASFSAQAGDMNILFTNITDGCYIDVLVRASGDTRTIRPFWPNGIDVVYIGTNGTSYGTNLVVPAGKTGEMVVRRYGSIYKVITGVQP